MKRRILFVVAAAFTLFLVLAFSPTPHAQGFKKIDMAIAYVQAGAPVELNSVTHGLDFVYSNAEVKNVSDRAVRAVTFGVLLHGSAPNHSEPILASSREMQTDIKPGGVRTLDVLDLTVKEVQVTATQLKSDRVIAEFGILGVQFNDGGSWIFDLQKNGGFSTSAVSASADPAATMRCKPTISSGLVALLDKVLTPLAIVLAQGYTCAISPNTEVGTNNVSSCKNRVCTHDEVRMHTCPYQRCQLQ